MSKCAELSRVLLILGLAAGIGLPGLASAMAPFLPQMVAVLIAMTAFRIGGKAAFGAVHDLRWSLPAVLFLQLGVPVTLAMLLSLVGALQSPLGLALVLATSAPAISGGASLAIILRQDPARVMQIMVLGTAVFPATVLLVLFFAPITIPVALLLEVGLRSLLTIAVAAAVGFVLRRVLLPAPTQAQVKALDGATVLFFATIVIALMAAMGPALRSEPMRLMGWAGAAFALSFGLQMFAVLVLAKSPLVQVAGPLAISAGNRNIALFLVALPPETVAPIVVFIACWQLPMYLTPILLAPLYRMVPAHE